MSERLLEGFARQGMEALSLGYNILNDLGRESVAFVQR